MERQRSGEARPRGGEAPLDEVKGGTEAPPDKIKAGTAPSEAPPLPPRPPPDEAKGAEPDDGGARLADGGGVRESKGGGVREAEANGAREAEAGDPARTATVVFDGDDGDDSKMYRIGPFVPDNTVITAWEERDAWEFVPLRLRKLPTAPFSEGEPVTCELAIRTVREYIDVHDPEVRCRAVRHGAFEMPLLWAPPRGAGVLLNI